MIGRDDLKKISGFYRDIPKGVKASIAFFIASLITKGIAYITTPFYTRLLTPDQYGQTSLFLTWLNVFGIIAMFNLQAGVFNNGMVDYPDKRDDYSFSMLILSNIITAVFATVLLSVYPLIKPWVQLDWPFVLLMIGIFMFQPAYNFWTSRQRYEYKYKSTVIWSVLSALLSPLVAVILLIFTSADPLYSRIFGAEVILLVIYIGFYFYLGKKNQWKINTKYWKSAFLFNLPLLPHYLSTYLLSSLDKVMISNLIDNTATAFYSVAYSVASVVLIVWSAVNGSLIPYTYEKCKENDHASISKVTLPILLLFAIVCIMVIILAPEVVWIMATDDYSEAIYVIPPIVGGVFFQVQYYIYANVVYYYKKPKFVMFASVIATVLNLILNLLFIPMFGYIAAGYTTLVCYLLQALIDYLAMKKVVGKDIYNMKFVFALSSIVILISLVSNLIYDLPVVRYMILAASVVLMIVFRKKIIGILKNVRKKKKA